MTYAKPFAEINQTDTAKRKLKNIAKNNNLPLEFVTTLYNFRWDLDPIRKTESYGWVSSERYTKEQFNKAKEIICQYLGISLDFELTKDEIITKLVTLYDSTDETALLNKFLIGGENKNNAYISEYATYHYLNNLTEQRLLQLDWDDEIYNSTNIFHYLFLKVFRGGCIQRYELFYVFTDLFFEFPFVKTAEIPDNTWHDDLIQSIAEKDCDTLTELIACCKGHIKGDKKFKKLVLESLSYSGALKTKNIDVSKVFIPEYRDELARHSNSNEWTYPLRMWNEKYEI